jgi:SRSO17 transposase
MTEWLLRKGTGSNVKELLLGYLARHCHITPPHARGYNTREINNPWSIKKMVYELRTEDIAEHAQDLVNFHGRFTSFFRTSTRDVSAHGLEYLKGQLLCESRRNMSKISVEVSVMNEQALDHFTSVSPWKDRPLMEAIAQGASERISSHSGTRAIILDESGIGKKGKRSVGVSRQYCGSLGKVDSCQVGMYLALSNAEDVTLIDRRLFLPREWIKDPNRCERAGIPKEERVYRTKAEIGLEMILDARARQIGFEFVGMDEHYGEQPWMLSRLEEEGIVYVGDVPRTTRVYLEYPEIGIPPARGGRPPRKLRVLSGQAHEVQTLLPSLSWHTLRVRSTQRGELVIRFAALRVWRVQDDLPCLHPVWLLIRQELDGTDTKYSFSNAGAFTPLQVLAQWQSRRYWVERALEDAKGLGGLDEYQVLGWRGWHHHTSMVLLAMLFLLELKQDLRPKAPLLSLQDAVEVLKVAMPRKSLSYKDAVDLIRSHHKNRSSSRLSRLRKQKAELKALGFLM